MKVKLKHRRYHVKDLENGDTFMYMGKVCMLMNLYNHKIKDNAVDLRHGMTMYITDDEQIEPVHMTVTEVKPWK